MEKKKKWNKKPQPKKIMVEFKPHRGRWKKAELIKLIRFDCAILKLEDGNIIKKNPLRKFRWGVVKKKRKKKVEQNVSC
jgi:hypothetical protein